VGQFTVLNGAHGVTEALAEIIQQASALTNMARRTLLPGSARAAMDGEPTSDAED
jgi:hypothetical protein